MALLAAAPKVGDPLTFYSVAAAIIPVLFLALIYQANVVDDDRSTPLARLGYAYAFVFSAAVAEIDAMRVLATQHPSTGG